MHFLGVKIFRSWKVSLRKVTHCHFIFWKVCKKRANTGQFPFFSQVPPVSRHMIWWPVGAPRSAHHPYTQFPHSLRAQPPLPSCKSRLGRSLRPGQLWKSHQHNTTMSSLDPSFSWLPRGFLSGVQAACSWHPLCCCGAWLPGRTVSAFPVLQQLSQAGEFDLSLILQLY